MDAFLQFINTFTFDGFSTLVAALIGFFSAIFSNKHANNKPKRIEIMEAEFIKVYFPIYGILSEILIDHPQDKININRASRINSIIEENFNLVHPKIYNTNKLLYQSIITGKCAENNHEKYLHVRFYRDIANNYEDLRRLLGYPSNKKANPILLNCRVSAPDNPIVKIIIYALVVVLIISIPSMAISIIYTMISVLDQPIIFIFGYLLVIALLSAIITKKATKNNQI